MGRRHASGCENGTPLRRGVRKWAPQHQGAQKRAAAALQGSKMDDNAPRRTERGHCCAMGCKNGALPRHRTQKQANVMLQGAKTVFATLWGVEKRRCAIQQRGRASEYHMGTSPALRVCGPVRTRTYECKMLPPFFFSGPPTDQGW